MKILKEEKEKKIQEIKNIMQRYVNDDNEVKDILDGFLKKEFIKVLPPEEEEEEPFTQFITLSSNFSRNGISRKPGNIILNVKNLVKSIPDLISDTYNLSSADLNSHKYLLIIKLGIAIWNALWENSAINIDKDFSIVLYVLWTNCNYEHEIDEEQGYIEVNCVRKKLKLSNLSKGEYTHAINYLCEIKSIKINNGIIKLTEGVKISY